MFRGDAQYSVDSKGRFVVPGKFREQLGEHFMITKGLDRCLYAFPLKEWEAYEEKIKVLPMSDPSVRKFMREFVGGATDSETDAQSRVIIPASLRAYANINKEIYMIGQLTRIEIWSLESWRSYSEGACLDDEDAARMTELGI